MPIISLTHTQIYTGFVGLMEDEIPTRHPLGKHLLYLSKKPLQMGMFSVSYALNEEQRILLIFESIKGGNRVVAQKTYWDAENAFEYFKQYAICYEDDGYWINAAGNRQLFILIDNTPGNPPALSVSIY